MPDQYNSEYTGKTVDDAVGLVKNNNCKIKWGNILTSSGIENQEDLVNTFVKRAGDTMSGDLGISKASPVLNAQLSGLQKGTAPSSIQTSGLFFLDKNGTANTNKVGGVSFGCTTSGVYSTKLHAFEPTNGSTNEASIGIFADGNNFYTSAPTPAANDNSTKIATTAWVKSEITTSGNIVHLTGTETISGNKTFSGSNTFSGVNSFSNTVSFAGTTTAITQPTGNNSTNVATTAFVKNVVTDADSKVVHLTGTETITGNKTFSGTSNFTGTTTAITQPTNDDSTNVATTAFVKGITTQIQPNVVKAGVIIWYSGLTAPSGYLICNGAAVSRTSYATLFAIIGTTFGVGDGSTTFNLPTLTDGRFIEGSTVAGTYYGAGLPDHNHTIASPNWDQGGGNYLARGGSGDGGHEWYRLMNAYEYPTWFLSGSASTQNSIYGASTTVQPQALTMLPCIKY